MNYSVDWIKKNMGISRKALLVYEKKGLIKPERNTENGYREYSDEDLVIIWTIKLLIELHYSLEEIDSMRNPEFDFHNSIIRKIEELEREKKKIEQLIGHAKFIKSTGRMPVLPKEMGSITFEDFLLYSHQNWNIYDEQQTQSYQKLIEKLVDENENSLNEEEEQQIGDMIGEIGIDIFLNVQEKTNNLAQYSDLEISNPQVQKLVDEIYEYYCKYIFINVSDVVTPRKFADYIAGSFVSGDVAILNRKYYGKEICDFIAKAIIYFGEHN